MSKGAKEFFKLCTICGVDFYSLGHENDKLSSEVAVPAWMIKPSTRSDQANMKIDVVSQSFSLVGMDDVPSEQRAVNVELPSLIPLDTKIGLFATMSPLTCSLQLVASNLSPLTTCSCCNATCSL